MNKKTSYSLSFILLIFLAIYISSAFTNNRPQGQPPGPTGEQLAKTYCVMCHLFPEPSLLDTATWKNHVLPNMGWRLGIRKPGDDPYKDMEPDEVALVKSQNVYPNAPLLPKENWQKIVSYYIQKAPAQPLPQKDTLSFENELTDFHPQAVFFDERQFPKTCLLKFDSAKSLLYIGDADRSLYAINGNLQLVSLTKTPSPPVDIDFSNPDFGSVLCIGSISPSDKKNGLFYSLDSTKAAPKFKDLARPVCVEEADLNGDGKKDILICQFGNHTGKLSWFDGGDPKKEHVLKLQPGARKVEVRDMNGDGKPDIVALMAQAKEELVMFINKGNGVFTEQSIYKFPPVYGVSYFELADFNHDGHPDILLTNGDNWDLSPIRKNFHGIRILTNDGNNHFKITQFFPFYGCSKAVARDFDHDGNIDIAAISFYDDPENPSHSFIYLKNNGQERFTPYATPIAANGKWLTMEVGDFNGDGYDDIALGSYVYSMSELMKLLKKGVESFPQVVILWNDKKEKP